jgi:hypothetical protein
MEVRVSYVHLQKKLRLQIISSDLPIFCIFCSPRCDELAQRKFVSIRFYAKKLKACHCVMLHISKFCIVIVGTAQHFFRIRSIWFAEIGENEGSAYLIVSKCLSIFNLKKFDKKITNIMNISASASLKGRDTSQKATYHLPEKWLGASAVCVDHLEHLWNIFRRIVEDAIRFFTISSGTSTLLVVSLESL